MISDGGLTSPNGSDGILVNQFIRSQDHKMVHNRLANQHSVERIFMHKRKPAQMQSSFFVELQRFNAMLLALERDKTSWRFRERQLAQSIFDSDLPRRD